MITGLLSMDASEGSTKHRDWMAEEFGVFPDNIDPKDLSAVNRHVLIVRHLIHLSGFVDELIDAVKTKFPSLTVRTVDGTESQNLGGGKGGAAAGATEATPPAANPPEPTPDGPQPPRSFSWQGKPHELPIEDPTLPWRLLVFLWGKPSVAVAEIAAVVWKNKRTRYATMKPTVTRLNNAMRVKGLPSIFWTKKRGGNCLVYHGPPLGSSVSR
jgi:hypothetical protein